DRLYEYVRLADSHSLPPRRSSDLHLDNANKRFLEDIRTHFRSSLRAVGEHNGNLDDLKPILQGSKFHFNLKRIAHKPDPAQRYGFQHDAPITHKARRGVADFNARDHSYVS